MRWYLPLCLLVVDLLGGTQATDEANPLLADLCNNGLEVKGGKRLPVPPPLALDKLDAKGQQKAIEKLARDDYPLDELLRQSPVAPQIYKFRDLDPPGPEASAHAVDLYFVAYGNIDKADSKTLEGLLHSNRKDTRITRLSEKELSARGLTPTVKGKFDEAYVYSVLTLLDRVQIQGTRRAVFSREGDTMVLASRLDPRFADDKEYANRWRSMTIEDSGKAKLGPLQPYEGSANYVQLTRLKEPAGAVFVEFHQVFLEPKGWFEGANPLRSKLPILLQAEVRAFRRELAKLTP